MRLTSITLEKYYIGRFGSTNSRNLEGFVHNMIAWRRAITHGEELDVYNAGTAKNEITNLSTYRFMYWVGSENEWSGSDQTLTEGGSARYDGAVLGTIHTGA